MLLRKGREGLPLHSPAKGHHEWRALNEGAGGEVIPLDREAGGHEVPPGGRPLPHQQEVNGPAEGEEGQCHGLAGQLT